MLLMQMWWRGGAGSPSTTRAALTMQRDMRFMRRRVPTRTAFTLFILLWVSDAT